MAEFIHQSVLLSECIEALQIKENGIYADGTLGGGGHSEEIAKRLKTGRLYGFDRDEDALSAAGQRLSPFAENVTLIHSNFSEMRVRLEERGVDKASGILLDLGVSSYQIDEKERGFSYMHNDAPLDMRMDRTQSLTAHKIVNTYAEEELADILRIYGEERFAKAIARHIVKARQEKAIETAGDLNRIIEMAIPAAKRRIGGHPSKRTFQALRIETNDELGSLKTAVNDMIDLLEDGGRLCIITFHSLEDRIVKQLFAKAQDPCTCPKEFPVCVCGKVSKGKVITRKPILPTEEELAKNSRAKSAKLRVFERREP